MNLNISSQEPKYNFLDDVRQLTHRIATIDPDLVMDDNNIWVDTENMGIRFCREQRTKLYHKVKRYQRARERTALVSKRKYYELINLFARNMLCRLPVIMEDSDHNLSNPSCKPLTVLGLLLIWEMHDKWKDKDDMSLTIPQDLDSDKKEIIKSYLHTIHTLDINDESEGTYAYLLHDYCRTMILYNCAMQFVYGADIETVRSVYGEYAEEAYSLYEDTINEMKAGDEIEGND